MCAHLVLSKLENGAFSGAKFVLIWCFFLQNGAPSWCKMCAHLVLSKLENGAFSGAKFVLIVVICVAHLSPRSHLGISCFWVVSL